MTRATRSQCLEANLEYVPSRRGRSSARRGADRIHLQLERLEARLVLSGFGPEDGSYIVENREGGWYSDVRIQPSNQAIVAVGPAGTLPGANSGFGVERYDRAGNVDASYGNAGLTSPTLGPGQTADGLFLQPDGKALVAGRVVISGGISLGLARLNVDGSPDATFGSGGWTGFDVQPGTDSAPAIGLQSSGKIVLAGESNSAISSTAGTQSALVARFKDNGAIDSGMGGFGQQVAKKPVGYTLTSYGTKSHSYTAIAVQPDDKLVTVGYNNYPDGSSQIVIARYTASGTLDKTFNQRGYYIYAPAGISNVWAGSVELQSDGKIVVAGSSRSNDGTSDMFVARFKATGQLDTTFGGGAGYVSLDVDGAASVTSETASGVAIQPDGKIVVAGSKSNTLAQVPAGVLVARLNSNGTLDSTFGVGGFKLGLPLVGTGYHDFRGFAVALQSDGNIIVAGLDYWGTTGSTSHPLLMRFSGATVTPAAGGAMAARDTNPQGIADPPRSASLNTLPAYFVGNINVLAASAIASSFAQAHTSLQRVSASTESVDEFMSQLADSLPVAPISMSKVPSTPLSSRTRLAEYQSIDLALADEGLNNSLHTMANDLLLSTLR